MGAIYKYAVTPESVNTIPMPKGAQVLTVQDQQGKPQIWALVDPDAELVKRFFLLVGTGTPIKLILSKKDYVGTFQMGSGDLVFHLFEIPKWEPFNSVGPGVGIVV